MSDNLHFFFLTLGRQIFEFMTLSNTEEVLNWVNNCNYVKRQEKPC